MILTCPSCSTRYSVDAASFAPPGRQVRCAKCGHVWFQSSPEPEMVPEPEIEPVVTMPSVSVPEPGHDFDDIAPAPATTREDTFVPEPLPRASRFRGQPNHRTPRSHWRFLPAWSTVSIEADATFRT